MGSCKWDKNKSWKKKTIRITRAGVKNPLGYSLVAQKFQKGTVVNTRELSYEAI
jgi:hypothetical protein